MAITISMDSDGNSQIPAGLDMGHGWLTEELALGIYPASVFIAMNERRAGILRAGECVGSTPTIPAILPVPLCMVQHLRERTRQVMHPDAYVDGRWTGVVQA